MSLFTDDELYLFCKTDSSEARLAEAKLYEAAGIDRFHKESHIYIGEHTATYSIEAFESLSLPHYPCTITSIKYQNENNEETTLPSDQYTTTEVDDCVNLSFVSTPTLYPNTIITIVATIGYASATMPSLIKHALAQHITYWFDNPIEVSRRFDTSFDRVLAMYRQHWC